MRTLLLDTAAWDLVLDVNGNIAVADEPYALAQDAASAVRSWLREVWYNTTLGVDYKNQFLGRSPNLPLLRSKMIDQAMTVPGVTTAVVYFTSITGRAVRGQVQVTDLNGVTTAANF